MLSIQHACGNGAGRCPAQPEQAARRGQLPCACQSQQQRGREPRTSQHRLDPRDGLKEGDVSKDEKVAGEDDMVALFRAGGEGTVDRIRTFEPGRFHDGSKNS